MDFHKNENMGLENETTRNAAANRGLASPAPTPDDPTALCSLIDGDQNLEDNDYYWNFFLGCESEEVNIDTLLGHAPPPAPAAVTGSDAPRALVDGGFSFGSNNNNCISTNILGTGGGFTSNATAVTLPHDDERHQNFKGYQTISLSSITAKGKETMIGDSNINVSNRSDGYWDWNASSSAISTYHDPSLASGSGTPAPAYTDRFDSLRQPPADKRTVRRRRSRLSSISFADNSNTESQSQVPRPVRVRPAPSAPPSVSARASLVSELPVPEVGRLNFLFSKQLQESDVRKNRIIIPKKNAEAHLRALGNKESTDLVLTDMSGSRVWTFTYTYWKNCNSDREYVLKSTGEFVRKHRLECGDTISLYKDSERPNYVIKVEEKKTKTKNNNKRKSNSSGASNLVREECDMRTKRDDVGCYYPHHHHHHHHQVINKTTTSSALNP